MKGRFHKLRRFLRAALLLILVTLPFLKVNGESAFRFDVPTLRLLFFGSRTGLADAFIVLVGILFLTFFTLLVTAVLGRVWCGWLCPQTVLIDATRFLEKRRKPLIRIAASLPAVAAGGVISAGLIGYFIAPGEAPALLRAGGTAAGIITWSWISLTLLLYLDMVLLRRKFCATVCPYAKLQNVLFDDRTLLVAFDQRRSDECRECKACVKACPMGIDIRKGTQMACIHCAECIDACSERMSSLKRKTLVSYFFGLPGQKNRGNRINVILSGIMSLLALALLVYLNASASPFEFGVRLAYTPASLPSADGGVRNLYELSFRNKTSEKLTLDLTAASPAGSITIAPSSVMVSPDREIARIPVTIIMTGIKKDGQDPMITITARPREFEKSISQQVYFILPAQK
jgi:cytochrome c oxidase accessory protein FixG